MTLPSDVPLFFNRELSQLAFNRRVLALAADADLPLLERLRFLCIFSSNLDEFFEIRVAGLIEQLRGAMPAGAVPAVEPRALYSEIVSRVRALVSEQYALYNGEILPALAAEGIRVRTHKELTRTQRDWVGAYFRREVLPLLTPIGLDPAHPFPQVVNKSLNFVVELSGKDAFGRSAPAIAIVKAPRVLPRVIELPAERGGTQDFIPLSQIIRAHIPELFPGRQMTGYSQFRVTRDSDLWLDEEEVKNLRQALRLELAQRQFGNAVRLEVLADCPESLSAFLLRQFGLAQDELYRVDGPVNLVRIAQLLDFVERPELKFQAFTPGMPRALLSGADIFSVLRRRDILLHHPFQSFEPVIDFVRQASVDPDVVAVRLTIYRTGSSSVLMETLVEAARRGKEVTVVVELMARFDEETNINWADRLEKVGAQVVYGLVGLKTHAKMALVVRREAEGLRRYAHLGTGNYHPVTTKLYTDFGLLTAHREICDDVNEVFMHLTSLAKVRKLRHLWVSPFTLHRRLIRAIAAEARIARAGRPARIVAKMNALLEEAVIKALYEASLAGVRIELVVRGACALRPGVPGLSENIRVRSIVGRFLEHSRIFWFHNDGADDVMLSSADWMGRNLFSRVELAFPVLDPALKKRVIEEGLEPYLKDLRNAWELGPDGAYRRRRGRRKADRFCAHTHLLSDLAKG